MDVAGGSGDLTRELLSQGFQSVVIDPRKDTKRCGDGIEQVFELFDVTNPAVRSACEGKDLLLGLHPDGAVNFIVEYACKEKMSFCIVPCCVFPGVYKRHLLNGDPVIEREQLV